VDCLQFYETELISWNEKFNLTAIRDPESIRSKHFLDSLSCILALRETPPGRLIDIGTGAGFPGIPLKIILPSMRLTMVESVGKKVEFCQHMARELGLEGVEVLHARAEDVGRMPAHRAQYDWAVARAVAGLPVLAEYLLPLVRLAGRVLAQKGESAAAEAHAAERALKLLGGRVRQLIPVALPGVADERYLVVIDKVAATPDAYPRRAGLPAKKPL
jgi:16S rRNA (guanine527-N7)-methyltransferase